MKGIMKSTFSILLVAFVLLNLKATTIVPFSNLGEMAKASEAVVLVKAERNYETTEGGQTYFATGLKVLRTIKGPLLRDEAFVMRNHHKKIGDIESIVWGDLEMIAGENYLLMLVMGDNGYWQPMMLSYAAFEEHEREGKKVLVPFSLGAEVTVMRSSDGTMVEPLQVYETEKMLEMLAKVTNGKVDWNKAEVATPYPIDSFHSEGRGTPPAHCSYISSAPTARWDGFPSALPVYYHSGGDAGCANADTRIQGVVGTLNGSYLGINMTDGGTHGFTPNCTSGSTGSEFTAWVAANLGNRSVTIQFDDPCNEIPDLSGCNGTLAFGGMYFSSATHTWDGMPWRTALWGYVVVNNGTGACQCAGGSTDYDVMMTHELTHALGIGHIDPVAGMANMNPSCCNFIQPLDIQCLDYTYLNPLPVELTSFVGAQELKAIDLIWNTASEYDNDYFIVERANLNGEFEQIAVVQGAGTSLTASTYKFTDERPSAGTNYYRLSQVDYDGTLNEGSKIAVDFYNGLNISLTPNPIKEDRLRIDVGSESAGTLQLEVFDMVGKPVYINRIELNKGRTIEELQLNNLSPGLYILRTQKDHVVQTTRFVKSN